MHSAPCVLVQRCSVTSLVRRVTAYALLMPVACLVVFMYSVGLDPRGVRVALVNDDAPERCGAWPGYPDGCEDGAVAGLSCRFLDLLLDSNDFIMVRLAEEYSWSQESVECSL